MVFRYYVHPHDKRLLLPRRRHGLGKQEGILSWRLSNTLDTSFCIEALQEAIATYGKPDIFNTDQGSQFTSYEFTSIITNNNISMDGQGRWRDNVCVERLWKTVKYEEIYLKAYESVSHAKKELTKFLVLS